MEGKTANLFWQLPSSDRSTQIELNTTKNLLKTLQDSDAETETTFLKCLCQNIGANVPLSEVQVSYSREYSKTPAETVEDIFLIGISQNGRTFKPDDLASVKKSGGRVDASITAVAGSTQYQFLLEIKTGGDNLTKSQLGKYCNKFGVPPENVATVQWREIFDLFEDLNPDDDVTRYLVSEFAEYIRYQKLDRNIALFKDTKYEKSITLYLDDEGHPFVRFQARQKGSSDKKDLTLDQFVDLFTEFFDVLGLDIEDRRTIFLNGDLDSFTEAVEPKIGSEIASTNIGFSEKARYRIIMDSHGSDGALIKLQEMKEDGGSAEFPNTYHFMLTEWEFFNVVRQDEGPGFSDETIEALFVDFRPERCF